MPFPQKKNNNPWKNNEINKYFRVLIIIKFHISFNLVHIPATSPATAMSEEQARKEAENFIKAAEGHLTNKSSFFGLFSSGPDYYEAIDAYNRAGNVYKSAKLCKRPRWFVGYDNNMVA
jgi:hypothetical protein